MFNRMKDLTMLVVLAAWTAFVVSYFLRDQFPDPLFWGIPAVAYGALYGLPNAGKKDGENDKPKPDDGGAIQP